MSLCRSVTLDIVSGSTAARILGIKIRTFYRWVERGRVVPLTKLDGDTGAYVFDRAAIVALRDERIAAERERLATLETEAS